MKPNKSACCISNCTSTTSELTFKFPANENEGLQWLEAIKIDELSKCSYDEIKKQKRCVCYKHFPSNAILQLNNGRRILKKGFLPTLNFNSPCLQETSYSLEEKNQQPGKNDNGKLAI